METLSRLREMGYQIQADGDKVRCRWQGEGKPHPEAVRPLLEELRHRKAEALEALREEAAELPTCDPFDSENCPPPGLILCLPDRDRPGWWIARRTGTLEPEGHGPHQVEAILDLDRLEQERA